MTSDQARKLLGGYATNSLTEAERKALFEAALDDQELFDALQQEQALKELLADPVSRNQIQQALAEPPLSRTAGPAWWSRWWAWGGAAGAVAAAVLIVAVMRTNPQPSYQVARVPAAPPVSDQDSRRPIAAPPEPKPEQLKPPPRKAARAARAVREPAGAAAADSVSNTVTLQSQNAAAPPPPPPPQATPAAVQQAQQSRSQQPSVQVQAGAAQIQTLQQEQVARDGERREDVDKASKARSETGAFAGAAGFVANYSGPLLRYSLAKRDAAGAYSPLPAGAPPKSGDALRVMVFPRVAGYLSLYQLDPSGDWKRLFPAADQGLLVAANANQTIPDTPIVVRDADQKLRLMLVPLAPAELSKDIKENAAQAKAAAAPLIVDITIGANKVP